MHISCVICSDLFTPTTEVFVTRCGHLFHQICILSWIQRKPSCPQCRNVVTESKIQRVYFNISSDDSMVEDVGTLINKVESLELQHNIYKKDIDKLREKIKKLKETNVGLRGEVGELEKKERSHESAMHALKEQITYFKNKSKETDRLTEEIVKLKGIIKNTENVQIALEGSREQVNDLIRSENNVESLAILAAILKKSLLDAERRKRDLENTLKRVQNEASQLKTNYSNLASEHSALKRNLQRLTTSYKIEIQNLKKLMKEPVNEDTIVINSDSDTSLYHTQSSGTPEDNTSLNNASSDKQSTVDLTDSPYLPVKSNPLMVDYSSFLNTKYQTNVTSPKKYSIFKHQQTKSHQTSRNKDVAYNGLGGSSKEDIYPSPKPNPVRIKRIKSATVTSNKLRKLAPLTEKKHD